MNLLVAGFGAMSEVATETTGATALETTGTTEATTDGAETLGRTTVTLGRGITTVVAFDQADVDLGAATVLVLVIF